MNRKRFLGSIASTLASLPFVGRLLAPSAQAGIRARVTQHLRFEPDQQIALDDVAKDADAEFVRLAQWLQDAVNGALESCVQDGATLSRMDIKWMNLLDLEKNPDGRRGHFSVLASRTIDRADDMLTFGESGAVLPLNIVPIRKEN